MQEWQGFHGGVSLVAFSKTFRLSQLSLRSSSATRIAPRQAYRIRRFRRCLVSFFAHTDWTLFVRLSFSDKFIDRLGVFLTQVCHRPTQWQAGRLEEDAQRFPEPHIVEASVQRIKDALFFQARQRKFVACIIFLSSRLLMNSLFGWTPLLSRIFVLWFSSGSFCPRRSSPWSY